jgi:iron(III) transport system permease protein
MVAALSPIPAAIRSAWRVRLPRLNWSQAGFILLTAALGYYVIYPLFLILLNSFNTARIGQPAVYGVQTWIDAWRGAGVLSALVNTLLLALCYQSISFPAAALIALVLARTNIPGARKLEFLFWLSFFIPSLSTTLGWMLLLDPHNGILNSAIGGLIGPNRLTLDIYSFWGIVWAHLMSHAVSFKVMLLTPAFRNMDAALEEAGRTSGASQWKTFLKLTLPIMTPSLVIVFMLGLVRLFESFEIELLLGVPFNFYVYSTKIVQLVRGDPPQLSQAAALGSITLALLMIAAPIQRRMTTRRSFATVGSRMKPALIDLGVWRWPVFGLVSLLCLMLVALPIASVLAASFMTRFGFFALDKPWTLAHWQQALRDSVFMLSLKNTLTVSLSVALLGVALYSFVAYVIVRGRNVRGRAVLDFVLWVPSIIPGALAGLGLLWMFLTTPVFQPFYGTILLLVAACLLGGTTLATQTFKASLLQLKTELEEAGRTSGANWLSTYIRVVVPLLAPTLIVVGALLFLFSAQAVSPIIMLATTRTRTLSLLTIEFLRDGLREPAAVTTVIVTTVTASLALVARAFGREAVGSNT